MPGYKKSKISKAIGTGGYAPPGSFCSVSLSFVIVQGTPSVVLTPPTTMEATNTDGSSFSVGSYVQAATYQTTTDTVHMESYLDTENALDTNTSFGMTYSESNTGSAADNIAAFALRPNTMSGAGSGLLLDGVSGSPVLSGMTVPVGTYKAAMDLDHAAKTCAFKDNQGQTATLSTKASSWENNPVYIAGTSIAGNVTNSALKSTWNPGTQADQLETAGSVSPCEAS